MFTVTLTHAQFILVLFFSIFIDKYLLGFCALYYDYLLLLVTVAMLKKLKLLQAINVISVLFCLYAF